MIVTSTVRPGIATSGCFRTTSTRFAVGSTSSQAVAASVEGLPRSVAFPVLGPAPEIRPRIRMKWTGTRGANVGRMSRRYVAAPFSTSSHSYRFPSGASTIASARAFW